MLDDIIDTLEDEYWVGVDDEWRSLVCTDDMLTEAEYREYLDAWWSYSDEDDSNG